MDARSDVYSLGTVLFEAVGGRAPFEAETPAATALARLQREPRHLGDLRPEAPPGLVAAISTAMARDPQRRFADAAGLRATLLDPRTLAPAPPPRSVPPAPRSATRDDETLVAPTTAPDHAGDPGGFDDPDGPTTLAPLADGHGIGGAPGQAPDADRPEVPEDRFQRFPVGPVVLASVVLASLLVVLLLLTTA